MKSVFGVCILSLSLTCHIRSQCWLTVVDDKGVPLMYATLSTSSETLKADSLGRFSLQSIRDSIFELEVYGFENQIFQKPKGCDTIKLSPRNTSLPPVDVISSKHGRARNYAVGYFTKIQRIPVGTMSVNGAHALYLPNERLDSCAIIKFIRVAISNAEKCSYSVAIHTVGGDGKPGKEIYSYSDNEKNPLKEIDLSNTNIHFPRDGVFIVISNLGYQNLVAKSDDISSLESQECGLKTYFNISKNNSVKLFWLHPSEGWIERPSSFASHAPRYGLLVEPCK